MQRTPQLRFMRPQSYGYELRLPLAVSIVPVHSTRLLGESFWVLLYLGSPQLLNRMTAAAKQGRRGSRPRERDNDAAADRLRRRRIDALSYSVMTKAVSRVSPAAPDARASPAIVSNSKLSFV